jgi:sugar phosphate isomerase/epimerase
MQYGAMNFPVLPLINEIDRIAGLGFDYLELAMDPPMAHYTGLENEAVAIKTALKERALSIVCHLPTFVSIADLTDSLRQASLAEMLASLKTAAGLGAEKVVFHPGAIHGMAHFVPDTARRCCLESIDAINHLATELDLTLCIENMFPGYGAFFEADEYALIFERYPDMQMTLDTGHAHIGSPGGSRLRHFVKRFGPRIQHVHISDNNGRADEHLPPGRGSIDFRWLIPNLKKIGFQGTVTFEIFTDSDADLKSSRDQFEKWWERA